MTTRNTIHHKLAIKVNAPNRHPGHNKSDKITNTHSISEQIGRFHLNTGRVVDGARRDNSWLGDDQFAGERHAAGEPSTSRWHTTSTTTRSTRPQ